MRKPVITILSLAAFCAAGVVSQAQPAPKLVTVSVGRAYDEYYKTQENIAKLRESQQQAQEQVAELQKQLEVVVEEYKALEEKTKSTALSKDGLAKAQSDAEKKLEEVNAKQQEGQQFIQNAQRSIQLREKNHRDLMIDEITKVIEDIRVQKGATLVLDTSGPTGIGLPGVLYADPAYDITEEVITELNKTKPAETPAETPAAETPATATP
ncbi:MAG: OmpH family outer membrane protein [Opitutaceae bacterium]